MLPLFLIYTDCLCMIYLGYLKDNQKESHVVKKLMSSYAKRVALPPGTLVHLGDRTLDTALLSLIVYDQETHNRYEPTTLEDALGGMHPDKISWLNITGLHDTALLQEVGNRFNLHPLTLEDILNTGQRPKVELFPEYIYFVLKMIHYDEKLRSLDIEQVSFILGKNFVITFQERPGDVMDALRDRIAQAKGRVRLRGADYLFYSIIDIIIDHYFTSLESLSDDIEEIEAKVLENPDHRSAQELHYIKRELLFLRKSVWPMREQITVLHREEHPLITPDTAPYMRDLYDHVIQAIDTIEIFRDMIAGLLDVYLSSISNRTNDVMRILTIITTIFMPLTFLAGIYGMNFEYMPELQQPMGYPAVLIICGIIAVGMFVFFRRKGWL